MSVNIYWLIMSEITYLSTILFSGAKLISLYLFQEKNSEKVMFKPVIYPFYPQIQYEQKENLWIVNALSTGFPHSYQQ